MRDEETGVLWVRACAAEDLAAKGRLVVRREGRQILLLATPDGPRACANRCPHEGFPLSEGCLQPDGRLVCNWHNWTFDLATGANLTGGDALRTYPVETRDGALWVAIADPPPGARRADALARLCEAMDDYDYDRIARELARHARAGGAIEEAIAAAVLHTYERLEYGAGHAYAAAPDWLALAATRADPAERLAAHVETVAHMACDVLREPAYPFANEEEAWDAAAFAAAVELRDEASAARRINGAFAAGGGWETVGPALARTALRHYAGFGHAAIYLANAQRLVEALGPAVARPLALSVMRYHAKAAREDLIPEFRPYADARAAWDGRGRAEVGPDDFAGLPVRAALARALESSGRPAELFDALLGAAAQGLLGFDTRYERRVDVTIGDDPGWLDLTHAVTFASAARRLCERQPALWPDALLQMALFAARNAALVLPASDVDALAAEWAVSDAEEFFERTAPRLIDHGEPAHIFACHWLKTAAAVRLEVARPGDRPPAATLLAALNRYLHAPMHRRKSVRVAWQMLDFVARE